MNLNKKDKINKDTFLSFHIYFKSISGLSIKISIKQIKKIKINKWWFYILLIFLLVSDQGPLTNIYRIYKFKQISLI